MEYIDMTLLLLVEVPEMIIWCQADHTDTMLWSEAELRLKSYLPRQKWTMNETMIFFKMCWISRGLFWKKFFYSLCLRSLKIKLQLPYFFTVSCTHTHTHTCIYVYFILSLSWPLKKLIKYISKKYLFSLVWFINLSDCNVRFFILSCSVTYSKLLTFIIICFNEIFREYPKCYLT